MNTKLIYVVEELQVAKGDRKHASRTVMSYDNRKDADSLMRMLESLNGVNQDVFQVITKDLVLPKKQSLDAKLLEAHDITMKVYQPWQIGLFHPDIEGKFLWYPKKKSLIREEEKYKSFKIVGEYNDTEDIIKAITKYLP